MQRFRFGDVTVEIGDAFTATHLPNGATVTAAHCEQRGQAVLAEELGYDCAEDMNREHDMLHSLLAHLLGLPASPTLEGVAGKRTYRHWREEEAAVFAIARYARCAGLDLMAVAERWNDGSPQDA